MQRESLDEANLAIRAQQGDVSAYEELVCRYEELTFRVAYVITRDPEMARDAAQSGFIKAYYALHRHRTGTPFRPWLLKIVTNEAHNAVRAQGRRRVRELQLAGESGGASASPEDLVLEGFSRSELLHAINALETRDREVIAYRYFFELSEGEMATVLDCRRGTVKSRLSRALGRLRRALQDRNSGVER